MAGFRAASGVEWRPTGAPTAQFNGLVALWCPFLFLTATAHSVVPAGSADGAFSHGVGLCKGAAERRPLGPKLKPLLRRRRRRIPTAGTLLCQSSPPTNTNAPGPSRRLSPKLWGWIMDGQARTGVSASGAVCGQASHQPAGQPRYGYGPSGYSTAHKQHGFFTAGQPGRPFNSAAASFHPANSEFLVDGYSTERSTGMRPLRFAPS
ncbi:hypothetical protein BGZ61DRAFT_473406 [Ilyonectria robusta]|uniref:uncharacterized protein n=1 Tax=Ilyonectria robusta TaxID=1079257 RepID=UPI001E8DED66|nr:uncharacterized protein BGZ61DRAFT_473406 [Ilyonectria robusta]KAH8734702.1 hypothetical protein BGZ61DRAFT_473406 [Ilyonectria robusta]